EGHVLGVESPFRDDRLVAQLPPVQAILRDESDQAACASAGQRFVALALWDTLARVDHWTEVVRARGVPGKDDIVGPASLDLVQPQFRLGPGDAVLRLGVTGHLGVGAV